MLDVKDKRVVVVGLGTSGIAACRLLLARGAKVVGNDGKVAAAVSEDARALEREGVDLDVVANRLDPRPDGWRVLFRSETACTLCGEPCKREDLAGLGAFAYAGDGFSDRCVALAADRVFARDGLARYLDAEGVRYEAFEDLHDIRRAL